MALSDTHIPDFAKRLPPSLLPALRSADLILHAGDVTARAVLEELEQYAPVKAALGNGDGDDVQAWGAAQEVHLDLDGVSTAMLHISGPARGRERRMKRRFPRAELVVFGHSHIPVDSEFEGLRLFNPGSPTWKRRQPYPTYGRIDVVDGELTTRIVELNV